MRVTPFAAGLVAIALLGACGDDDSEDTAPASTDQSTEQETTVSPTSKPEPPTTLPTTTTQPPPSTSPPPSEEPTTAPTTAPTSAESKPPSDSTTPSTTAPSSGSVPSSVQARIDAAIADLAARQGVDAAAVTVVDAREVTWPDSSLGCPQPGMAYMQVLTSGFLLVLDVNGRQFEYHGGTGGDLFLCENPRPPVPGGVGST